MHTHLTPPSWDLLAKMQGRRSSTAVAAAEGCKAIISPSSSLSLSLLQSASASVNVSSDNGRQLIAKRWSKDRARAPSLSSSFSVQWQLAAAEYFFFFFFFFFCVQKRALRKRNVRAKEQSVSRSAHGRQWQQYKGDEPRRSRRHRGRSFALCRRATRQICR